MKSNWQFLPSNKFLIVSHLCFEVFAGVWEQWPNGQPIFLPKNNFKFKNNTYKDFNFENMKKFSKYNQFSSKSATCFMLKRALNHVLLFGNEIEFLANSEDWIKLDWTMWLIARKGEPSCDIYKIVEKSFFYHLQEKRKSLDFWVKTRTTWKEILKSKHE